jgi:diphthamide synthase (EF-2-diphthine--ammonia ligase)
MSSSSWAPRCCPTPNGVDLSSPEVTASSRCGTRAAYLFSERVDGAGGLPLGVEGRAVALLSGGYDSAVAAWLLLKRGVALDYVFCNLGGDAYERAVVQVGKALADEWSYGTRPRLHVVDFGDVLQELKEKTRDAYWQVVLKRLMYRAACTVAAERGAGAIITGEAVGQVSSQTLPNLRAIETVATLPVLRPLIGFDKDEIIDRARSIGTAALSEQVKEYCAIAPGYPVTAARVERVDAEEGRMDLSVLDAAVAGTAPARPAGTHAVRPRRALPLHRHRPRRRRGHRLPARVTVPELAPEGRITHGGVGAAPGLPPLRQGTHVRPVLRTRHPDRVPRRAHAAARATRRTPSVAACAAS